MKELHIQSSKRAELLGWGYLAFQQLALSPLVVWINTLLPQKLDAGTLNFIIFCINFLATILIFWEYLLFHIDCFLQRPIPKLLTGIGYLGWIYIGNFLVNFAIFIAFPDFSNVNNQNIQTIFADHFYLLALGTVILVPVAEELLYRGLIFRVLYRVNPILGYVAGTLVFCAIHVVGYVGRYDNITLLVCFIQYLPGAWILCRAYVKTDCIYIPILIHMTNNLISVINMR